MKEMFLGVDGGASKTAGVLIEADGFIAAQYRGSGLSITGKPCAETCAVLFHLVEDLCEQADITRNNIRYMGMGLKGIDFAEEYPLQLKEIAEAVKFPAARTVLVNDGMAALWGSTQFPAAVLLQHGSAFTGAFRKKYGQENLFDHLGVGHTYDLRKKLLILIARMIDGRFPLTPLKEKVLNHFGIFDESKYGEALFRKTIPEKLILNTVPLVFNSWIEGDKAANDIIEHAIADYALAAKAMIDQTGCPDSHVIFGGGVIAQSPERFWNLLTERVKNYHAHVTVKRPDLSPETGAAIMAAYKAGYDPERFFQMVFEKYEKKDS